MFASPTLSRLGYDTRSLRSALVMGAVDALNPFKRPRRFQWEGPCVVSSIAGLGDLFIHLPLIAGIVHECRQREIKVRVALRPTHGIIGEQCGWNVAPFDDALEEFFKQQLSVGKGAILRRMRQLRRDRARLWINLTGNAVSAMAIKLAGARHLAARTTRGGRSLVDYPLPHRIQENEYGNVETIAKHLGCQLNRGIFQRLRGEPIAGTAGSILLSLTTACRWKNWPLQNFLELADRFPAEQFTIIGLNREVLPEEATLLARIRCRPNVFDFVDRTTIPEMIRLIAHSVAVVTNDTSVAHIAYGFGKPGAVLFGPASPATFAPPAGLRIFHDHSCPLHPCVQWHCGRPNEWCMRKIPVHAVSNHLAAIISLPEPVRHCRAPG